MDAIKRLLSKSTMIRLLSGIVLVLIALLTVHIGGDVLYITSLLLSLIAAGDLYKTLELQKKLPGIIGYISIITYYVFIRFHGLDRWALELIILSLMIIFSVFVFSYPKYKVMDVSIIMLGILYGGIMLSYVYKVRMTPDGRFTVWLIYLCSWGCDTCAYMVYDEDYEEYVCDVDMDEDDFQRLMEREFLIP